MLEGLATWVLNTYLGKYVENLNTDQLSIGILNGNVELENLPLRKDALRALNLPVEVKAGFIGKLQLQIPLRRMKSEAWVIRISHLYVVAGPPLDTTYDEETEKEMFEERKQAELKSLEEKWKAGRQVKSTGFWSALTSSVASSIGENLQLIVDDMHFRYEDSTIDPSHPLAVGVMIKKLAVQSTDEEWQPKFVTGASMMHKLVELEQLAVYWDVDAALVGDVPVMELKDALNRTVFRKGTTVEFNKHDFILEPVSACVRLIRDYSPKPLRSTDKPRFQVEFELEEIPICLSDQQYHGTLRVMEAFNYHNQKRKYRKWRPTVPMKSNALLYWQFAIFTILEPIRERSGRRRLDFFLSRARNNVLYVTKYEQQLTKGTVDAVDKEVLDRIEQEYSVEEIVILRSIVYERIKREADLAKAQADAEGQTNSLLQRWFPGWTGWVASTPQADTSGNHQAESTATALEDELVSVDMSSADESIFKRDSVFAHVLCKLKGGYLKLKSFGSALPEMTETGGERVFGELRFSELRLSVETRLRSNSLSIDLSLHSLCLCDRVTQGSLFPEVIKPQRKDTTDFESMGRFQRLYTVEETGNHGDRLFHLTYEKNPMHSNADYHLAVSALPLDLVYNKMFIDRVKAFFSPSDVPTKARLYQLAKRRYEELKTQTKAELRQTFNEWTHAELKEAKTWDIQLSIDAPHIIFPESFTDMSLPMVVLDLGHFSFGNYVPPTEDVTPSVEHVNDEVESECDSDNDVSFETPPSTPPSEADITDGPSFMSVQGTLEGAKRVLQSKGKKKDPYNRYTIEAADLQILVGLMRDDWKQAHSKGVSPLHVVDKFTISLQLERRLSFSTDPGHPNATAYGNLPNLVVHVDEAKIQAITNCIKSISESPVGDQLTQIALQNDVGDNEGSYASSLDTSGWGHGIDDSDDEEAFYSLLPSASIRSTRRLQSCGPAPAKREQKLSDVIDETMVESRMLVARFAIGEVNIGLNSRGRPICELRIPGLRLNVVQRPYNTHILAVVQDLLMVDALQKFGGEYELLISSCSDLEPTQLANLSSIEVISPVESRQSFQSQVSPGVNVYEAGVPDNVDDALVSLEVNQVVASCPDDVVLPGKGARRAVSLNVKTLDIIANQETIVELMGFFNCAFPDKDKDEASLTTNCSSVHHPHQQETSEVTEAVTTDIAAEFHCLKLLLVRDENRVGSQSFGLPNGRKVASVCLNDLCLHASLGSEIKVTGSVEGVEVLDSTPEGWLHREIFKIGVIPGRRSIVLSEKEDEEGPQRAFSFELSKQQSDYDQTISEVSVKAQLAALHYLHTQTFLNEIQLCASDFQHFTLELATSIRTAAAGVAMGIVGQKETLKGGVNYLSKSLAGYSLDETDGLLAEDTFDGISKAEVSSKVFLYISIGSPVLLVPRGSDSEEMFIAHLGHITASNSFVQEDDQVGEVDRLAVTVKDMHLFSCQINTNEWQQMSSMEMALSVKDRTEILHDTTLKLTINRSIQPIMLENDDVITLPDAKDQQVYASAIAPLYVSGEMTTPLKVTLSKPVFKQALATLDFVTGDKTKENMDRSMASSKFNDKEETNAAAANDQDSKFHPLVAQFAIPEVSLIVRGTVASNQGSALMDEDIVEVSLEHFSLMAEKREQFITQLEVKLHGLLVKDLIQQKDTKYDHIISSYLGVDHGNACPSPFPSIQRPFGFHSLSQSLLKQSVNMFHSLPAASSSPIRRPQNRGLSALSGQMRASPIGEPSNVKQSDHGRELDLVNVNVLLVDKQSPKFVTKYESVNRFVDVDFNVLDAVVNLQTWVILFDFFGIGVPDQMNVSSSNPRHPADKSSTTDAPFQPNVAAIPPDKPNMNIAVRANALTLTLNKSQYPLAKASLSGLQATVLSRKTNNCISGMLKSLSLRDVSPNGDIYKERLSTVDNKEVMFNFVKYSLSDWELKREYDVSVKLAVPAVRYVHTQRFLQETVAFCQHFVQIMDAYQRMKAAAADNLDYRGPTRSPRILLDIKADSPLVLVPRSSASVDMLVIDLGHLRATNKFQFAGSPGAIRENTRPTGPPLAIPNQSMKDEKQDVGTDLASSYGVSPSIAGSLKSPEAEKECLSWEAARFTGPCLLDCITLSLSDMDVYTAKREDGQDQTKKSNLLRVGRNRGPMLDGKCKLNLRIERNLCNDLSKAVPEFLVAGQLSSVHVLIDPFQLALIKDLLDYNLGEPLEEFERPESVIRDPIIPPTFDGVWTVIDLTLELVNVNVQLVLTHERSESRGPCLSLAQFELETSQLHLETFSDKSKTVNLRSGALRANDIRQQDATKDEVSNKFTKVLSPGQRGTTDSPQLEISYRMTEKRNRLSVVLHQARLVVMLDWLLRVKEFLLTKPEDVKKQESSDDDDTDEVDFHNLVPSPVTKSRFLQKQSKPLDISLSITQTDFIVVEDTANLHSHAVILKWTLVLTSRESDLSERSLSMSLSDIELFSCRLGNEEETALSIIDPASISVSLDPHSLSLSSLSQMRSQSTANQPASPDLPTLEIVIQNGANVRLSYRDLELFLAILSTLKHQLQGQSIFSSSANETEIESGSEMEDSDSESQPVNSVMLRRLRGLGYREDLCEQALHKTGGDLNRAADWLVDNAPEEKAETLPTKKMMAGSIDIRCSSLRVTVIDDCGDSDVPLTEVSISKLHVSHNLLQAETGTLQGTIQGEYYNTNLGAWEPFLEPLSCKVKWSQVPNGMSSRRLIKVGAENNEQLQLNVTSMLLETIKRTQSRWSEEYSKFSQQSSSGHLIRPTQICGRTHFVPFILRNNAGCHLQFATSVVVPSKVSSVGDSGELSLASLPSVAAKRGSLKQNTGLVSTSEWKSVAPGEDCPFGYETHKKRRHHRSSTPQLYQLQVQLDGWRPIFPPISVDKVGVFFRYIEPQTEGDIAFEPFTVRDSQPVRVIFAISVVGATKIINVRSGLVFHNKMDIPVEVTVERPKPQKSSKDLKNTLPPIQPFTKAAVPLHLNLWNLRARPVGRDCRFSESNIEWRHVVLSRQQKLHCCYPNSHQGAVLKFCTTVQRDGYPKTQNPEPGHTITIQPPITVYNLLPVDMTVRVLMDSSKVRHPLKPGKRVSLYEVDPRNGLNFGVILDGFPHCEDVFVPLARDYILRLCVWDSMNRPLWLYAKTEVSGKALKVYVLCPFWLENCTGLPLIFKNDGSYREAAGQHEEHEQARSMSPLLFSYSLPDLPNKCCVRVGNYYQRFSKMPLWSQRFRLEKSDGDFIQVHVSQGHNRPDIIHEIGYTTRRGKGLYVDTMIVKFVTRFMLFNNSSHRLAYSQRYETQQSNCTPAIALPNSVMPFNWSRVDLDQLLCIRIQDIADCQWSGGFKLNVDNSFHVIMRGALDRSYFIRVQTSLKDATYHVVFSDAGRVPPPFRIENFSKVPIVFYQKQQDSLLTRELKPQQSVPYAWDEPTCSQKLVLAVVDGSQKKLYDINEMGEKEPLTYENYSYIAAECTVLSTNQSQGSGAIQRHINQGIDSELVLDVPQGTAVIFRRRESNRISQLWRMTAAGQLEHMGSAFMRRSERRQLMVLDITDDSRSRTCIPLVIRKLDRARASTQTWKFDADKRLSCGMPRMFVQPKGEMRFLVDGCDAVLALDSHISGGQRVSPEQVLRVMKQKEGSGSLSVHVTPDGPTRIIQIVDKVARRMTSSSRSLSRTHQLRSQLSRSSSVDSTLQYETSVDQEPDSIGNDFQVILRLGVALSVINSVPEEVCYLTLSGLEINVLATGTSQSLDVKIQQIQADNQLIEAQTSAILYRTQHSSRSEKDGFGACRINAKRSLSRHAGVEVLTKLDVSIRPMTLQLEERLLLKLLQFGGFAVDEDSEIGRDLLPLTEQLHGAFLKPASVDKLYYINKFTLYDIDLKLSLLTSKRLSDDLLAVRRQLPIILFQFENASIVLDAYSRDHSCNSLKDHLDNIGKHYNKQFTGQAASIIGSVDFLGNPFGLLSDVTSGVSGVMTSGNLPGLVTQVAHGLSDTASKLTGTASNVLEKVTMDEQYEARRARINEGAKSSGEHLKAGAKGLAYGLLGGLTSIVSQTYEGATREGIGGIVTGLAKGVAGTVTKPAVGLLDLASGAAAALSAGTALQTHQPEPVRLRRYCIGMGGVLPQYSSMLAKGWDILLKLNDFDMNERLIAYEGLRFGEDKMCVIISSSQLFFFGSRVPTSCDDLTILVKLADMERCDPISKASRAGKGMVYYLQLVVNEAERGMRTKQVRCDTEKISKKIAQEINCAKRLLMEQQHMVSLPSGRPTDIW